MEERGVDSMPSRTDSGADRQRGESEASPARALMDQAKDTMNDRVSSVAATRKSTAADALAGLAESLSTAGQQLEDRNNGAGRIVQRMADRLDRLARDVDSSEVGDLVGRAEDWARANPALFLGGAFVLGVLGARFMKASQMPTQMRHRGSTPTRFTDREIATPPIVEER